MKTTQIGLDLAKSVVEVCHKFLQDVRARQQQTRVSAQSSLTLGLTAESGRGSR